MPPKKKTATGPAAGGVAKKKKAAPAKAKKPVDSAKKPEPEPKDEMKRVAFDAKSLLTPVRESPLHVQRAHGPLPANRFKK